MPSHWTAVRNGETLGQAATFKALLDSVGVKRCYKAIYFQEFIETQEASTDEQDTERFAKRTNQDGTGDEWQGYS